MSFIASFLPVLFLIPFAHTQQAHKVRTSAPVRIGTAAKIQGGIRLNAEDVRGFLQRGPTAMPQGNSEMSEGRKAASIPRPTVFVPASFNSPLDPPPPISPLPSISWQATTGSPASPAFSLTPADPQIAVSSTHVVVGMNGGMFFYTKDGKPYPNGNNFACTFLNCNKNFFQPIINNGNLGATNNGQIDSFSDLRVIFDPYRKRFWAIATGACRSLITYPPTGQQVKCAFYPLSKTQRRSVIGLAVSATEDPAGAWYFYWWDAAVGWGTNDPAYRPGDLGDYPSLGINATTVDITVKVTDANLTSNATRVYPHLLLLDATAMANNKPPSEITATHLYPSVSPLSMCDSAGLLNPNNSCPDAIIQPTVAHGDPQASYFISFESEWSLVIWKVTNQFHPVVQSTEVPMSPHMNDPANAPQKGSAAQIKMSNLSHSPLKAIWRAGALYIVTNDAANQNGRSLFRTLRLPTSEWPYVPSPEDVGSGGDQVRGGSTSTSSFGWPAIEVAPNRTAVVVYTRTGSTSYADIRYNVWPHDQIEMLGGRILKYGEAPTAPAGLTPWGDLAGASIEFENGKETDAIWIAHQYGIAGSLSQPSYRVWVGKISVAEAPKPPCPAPKAVVENASCQHEGQTCRTTSKVKCFDPELKKTTYPTVLANCTSGRWSFDRSCP